MQIDGQRKNDTDKAKPGLRLEALSISGFKAVKESSKISVGALTLLIGRNGSGKSSVVEALQWLQESLSVGLQRATEDRFQLYEYLRNKRSRGTSIHLEFSGPNEPIQYYLEVSKAAGQHTRPIVVDEEFRIFPSRNQRKIIWTTKGRAGPAVRNIRRANPEREGDRLALSVVPRNLSASIDRAREFLRRMVVLRLSPTSMTGAVMLEPRVRGAMIDEQGRGLPALLAKMRIKQRAWVRRHVSRVISGIENIKVVQTEKARGYFAATERMLSRGGTKLYDIPAWMLSEGTRRMTALFALLAVEPQPSLLVIEEIENGLDPWTLEYVLGELRAATQRGIQIILTTHSPFLLDHVGPEEVIHVRRERGDSTYTTITSYRDVIRYGGVVAPGAMYLSGYLTSQSQQDNVEEAE
jgi:predicted ATPase